MNPEYSSEGLMLKLKHQNFSYLKRRANSLEKILMLQKTEGRRRRGWQRMRWLDSITDSVDMSLSKFWEMVKDQEVWHAVVHGVPKSWTWFSNWTTIFLKCKSNQVPPSPALDLPASLSRDPHSILRDCRAQWQFSMHFCVPHLTVNSVCTTLPSVLSVKSCTYWKPNKWVRIQWRFSR